MSQLGYFFQFYFQEFQQHPCSPIWIGFFTWKDWNLIVVWEHCNLYTKCFHFCFHFLGSKTEWRSNLRFRLQTPSKHLQQTQVTILCLSESRSSNKGKIGIINWTSQLSSMGGMSLKLIFYIQELQKRFSPRQH